MSQNLSRGSDTLVGESEFSPPLKDVRILQQDIAAGLEVVFLADSAFFHRSGNRIPVLGMNECHVIDDENIGLFDGCQFRRRSFRGRAPVAAPIESPGAAEGAIPGTAPGKFDGCAGIQFADEIFVAPAGQIPGGGTVIDAFHHDRSRAFPVEGQNAGKLFNTTVRKCLQQQGNDGFPFTAHDAVYRPLGVFEHLPGNKRDAVSACENKTIGALYMTKSTES